MAAATADQLASKTVVDNDHSLPSLDTRDVSSEQANLPTLSDTQATLTSVSSDFADADPEAVPPAENPPKNESIHVEDNTEMEAVCSKTDEEVLDITTELPSAEDSKQAFDSIMELLSVAKPRADSSDTVDGNQATFDEFKELLSNPEKLQQQEEEIKSSDKFSVPDDATQSEGEIFQVVSSSPMNPVSSYPDVLKSTACQDSKPNQDEEENNKESMTEDVSEAEAKWPDIGADVPKDVPGNSKSDKCDFAEAGIIESVLSNEHYQSDNHERLLMPSAIADVQDLGMQGSNLNVDLSNSTPDLLDETSSGVKQSLELEEGTVKTKSKPRKRSKRGKAKQNTGPVGVAEVLEVSR